MLAHVSYTRIRSAIFFLVNLGQAHNKYGLFVKR